MKNKIMLCLSYFLLSIAIALLPTLSYSQSTNHLQSFDQFIGEWELDNSLQVFEWGPGKTSVMAKSYQTGSDGSRTLVSEGMWFWHPGKQEIKGYVTATNIPVVFFDYTTTFENGGMASDLTAYDKNGIKSAYREVMEMQSDSTYKWILMQQGKAVMEGVFMRE
ncbi:hypothetical protein SAMN05443144_10834 [Fodinibius roseus]|uniref:DUF1579 domain-containing protein n=1 Tax=Fodinibius roseus TaxID=1194090 RepID=A0A1M5B8X4_9BACT|nr:hypothetical protein [Fodinibius roseus]SHF38895.1 hypothetical protein SAMN05443144_10834 [Fodinibius roseus]